MMTDTHARIIRKYFKTYFSGPANHTGVRELLMDDFTFRGPLMEADSADEYLEQLTAHGEMLDLHAEITDLISEGNQTAVLVNFQGPRGMVRYAQWFTFREGKIQRLEVLYDPRNFLA